MENLWKKLSKKKPYVLEDDREIISEFNKVVSENFKIKLGLIPEPFIGNKEAKIVLLNLNPGVDGLGRDSEFHKQKWFIDELFLNLEHSIEKYPFFWLNPLFKETPGSKWWFSKLKDILNLVDKEKLANNLLVIEYFPYHSKSYKKMKLLPSQKYSFYLVKEAIKRNAEIIIMRSEELWIKAVPELEKVGYYTLKNKQAPNLSNKNIVEVKKRNYVEKLLKKIN